MPKSSSLSLAMRSKGGRENVGSPLSPRSPGSPNPINGSDPDATTPTAPFHDMPQSPASPKPRKDSKNIFSNFSATKSSSRITNPENSLRQVHHQEVPTALYANGRGGSTPELNRTVLTPTSDGRTASSSSEHAWLTSADNRSDVTSSEQRSGSGRSTETSDHAFDNNAKRGGSKPKKAGMLGRSKSIKLEEGPGTLAKLNKAQPAQLSPDPTATWSHNGEAVPLKTAPLEKDKSWRQNIAFGKLRTHSADRHDGSQHAQRVDDDNASRKDKAEQSSLASGSYNESRGAQLMSNIGFGARKMGEKIDSARKGMFGKLGRSSSNHERELQIPKEAYQFKIIHTPLVEQTRLTRISSRLENSKDKTEFWMPALPWRCIEYVASIPLGRTGS